MTAQTANKVTVPVGSDGWNPVAHIKGAFESAGIIVPVNSSAERDELAAKYPGGVLPIPTHVTRKDVVGWPTETWDGSAWNRSPVVTAAAPTPDGLWAITGGYLKTVVTGLAQVTATLQLVRTGPSMLINTTDTTLTSAIVPAGFRPSTNAFFNATVNTNFGVYNSSPQLVINTGGALVGRSTSGGAVSLGTGYTLFISVSWYI